MSKPLRSKRSLHVFPINCLVCAGLILVAHATGRPVAADSKLPAVLHEMTAGDITAHFGGDVSLLDDRTETSGGSEPTDAGAKRLAVTALWFTFAGDAEHYLFEPTGTLTFSDWTFDVFSPDGRYVLLLQDRFGPYHVVRTDHLKAYLTRRQGPDHVIMGRGPGDIAAVHDNAKWVSSQTIEYQLTCCGTVETARFELPPAGS